MAWLEGYLHTFGNFDIATMVLWFCYYGFIYGHECRQSSVECKPAGEYENKCKSNKSYEHKSAPSFVFKLMQQQQQQQQQQ